MAKKFSALFFIVFLSFFITGNIYFWTDENGIKHYSNTNSPLNGDVQELEESREILKKIASPENKEQTFNVLKIYDGDTIQVKGLGLIFKIRLVGIDAPEIGYNGQQSQPFSRKAKTYLTTLLKNKNIRLKSYGTGGYNRQLAEIFYNNENINIKMIRAGLAEVYTGRRPKLLDSEHYLNEQAAAKRSGLGIWTQGTSYKSPKIWRKEHPRK